MIYTTATVHPKDGSDWVRREWDKRMSDTRIKVPEGMMSAFRLAMQAGFGGVPGGCMVGLKAALRWLDGELGTLAKKPYQGNDLYYEAIADVRRIYDEPEPEVLEDIKDLLLPDIESGFFKPEILNERLYEAFRRGQKVGPK